MSDSVMNTSNTSNNIKELLDSLSSWHQNESFSEYLCKVITDPHQAIDTLNKCTCCTRHAINRPQTLENCPNILINYTQYTSCNCSCRHMTRQICRAFKETLPTNTPPTTIEDDTISAYIGLDENPPLMSNY
jgi:hypothetical protein